jgi:hypothetical protein
MILKQFVSIMTFYPEILEHSTSITWELVKNAEAQPLPDQTESRICILKNLQGSYMHIKM